MRQDAEKKYPPVAIKDRPSVLSDLTVSSRYDPHVNVLSMYVEASANLALKEAEMRQKLKHDERRRQLLEAEIEAESNKGVNPIISIYRRDQANVFGNSR